MPTKVIGVKSFLMQHNAFISHNSSLRVFGTQVFHMLLQT